MNAAPSAGRPAADYVPALDGMRALAILAVMIFHASESRFPGGFLGVDIFFVLSGYLITSLLLKEFDRTEQVNLGNFYIRRGLRLLPALLLVIACVSIFSWLRPTPLSARFDTAGLLSALFYISNWQSAIHGSGYMGVLNHTWSLAIEEQFYLLWPAILLFMLARKINRPRIALVMGALLIVEVVWRTFLLHAGAGYDRVYFGFDTHGDGLIMGCLIALISTTPVWRHVGDYGVWFTRLAIAGSIALLAAFLTQSMHSLIVYEVTLTMVVLVTGTIVVSVLLATPSTLQSVLRWGPLVQIGKISYGLYLWHVPIFWLLPPYGLKGDLVKFPLTFLVAGLSYHFLERPCLRLKDRFHTPSSAPTPSSETAHGPAAPALLS